MAGEHKISVTMWSGSWDLVLACIRSADSDIETKYPDRAKRPKRDEGGLKIADVNKLKTPDLKRLQMAQKNISQLIKAVEDEDSTDALMAKLKANIEAAEFEVGGIPHYSGARFWNCIDWIDDKVNSAKVEVA